LLHIWLRDLSMQTEAAQGWPSKWRKLRVAAKPHLETGEAAIMRARMALSSGTKLGPYAIGTPPGAGGVGEVEPLGGRESERSEE
jgi:hypothetical protein